MAVAMVLATLIRLYYAKLAYTGGGRVIYLERPWQIGLQGLCSLSGVTALLIYILRPRWLTQADLPLPDWLRWGGAGLLAAGLAGLTWTHHALGENFSLILHVRQGQRLVTSGPYRWVRHPMYSAFYVIVAGGFLLTANWLVGLPWVGLAGLITLRVKQEEAVMRQTFGRGYDLYRQTTGRFWPKF